MKKIFILTLIVIITLLGANFLVKSFVLEQDIESTQLPDHSSNEEVENSEELLEDSNEQIKEEKVKKVFNKKDVKNRIDVLRKRFATKGLIQKGDTYLENNQLLLALRNYLKAIEENPKDKKLIKRIGDTYYEMKQYARAYKYYKDIIGFQGLTSERVTLAYINSLELGIQENINLQPFQEQIATFGLSESNKFFYITALDCIIDNQECQNSFNSYILQGNGSNNLKIQAINKAFKNSKGSQINKPYFKNTYFTSAIFQSGFFTIANILAKNILKKKPDYLPVIKMVAKGSFELGLFEQSKKYLLLYNTIDKEDPKINYMLGIVNIKLHTYILSNIYFIKAAKLGYADKSNISRRLIYNYYLVEDNKRMMKEFKNLIDTTTNTNSTDYSLAIYYSLINNDHIQANKWVNQALELYPKNENFYGYKGWIYKEAGNLSSAEDYLKNGLKINAHNPLINLNLGIVEAKRQNFLKAKIYFKNTIKEDPNGDFGMAAGEELIKLEQNQQEFEQSLEDTADYYQ